MDAPASLLDPVFVLILALIGAVRWLVPNRTYRLYGACCSLLVIGWFAPATAIVIGGMTLFHLYPLYLAMRTAERRQWSSRSRHALLATGIGGLVVILLAFKLHRHFALPGFGNPLLAPHLLALVGFSYFIFRAISFLHIQAILTKQRADPATLLLYTLFPATITSGPIQKFQDFNQQLAAPEPLTWNLIKEAGYRITRGYFRKIVVAFFLYGFVETLLARTSFDIATSALTVICLYVYFYFDFAGYSDIAIGFGLLLGIRVPENFRKPFLATTVSEFWRNWHITLVDWFRDNVFIPLGGMTGSRNRAALLGGLVMVLCGAWHGLTVGFLAWGAWHGLVLFVEGLTGSKPIPPPRRHGYKYWRQVLWTNARVALPSVLFLPEIDTSLRVLGGFLKWRAS